MGTPASSTTSRMESSAGTCRVRPLRTSSTSKPAAGADPSAPDARNRSTCNVPPNPAEQRCSMAASSGSGPQQ